MNERVSLPNVLCYNKSGSRGVIGQKLTLVPIAGSFTLIGNEHSVKVRKSIIASVPTIIRLLAEAD
jgi:hypothetical protein